MLTRIEIDGFKTFEAFALDLEPLTAIVGPNASGKSNLFDALKFLSLLSQHDISTAMQELRGEPDELFRRTPHGTSDHITFAVEAHIGLGGTDAFGTEYKTPSQRIRYELSLGLALSAPSAPRRILVRKERCTAIMRRDDKAPYLGITNITPNYGHRKTSFLEHSETENATAIRQDGPQKRGRPVLLSLREASRTALSTISTAEFPHLYALREMLSSIRFLEINPRAARNTNDRFSERNLKADASNLAAVLAHLKAETRCDSRPDGVLSDIASDLTSLIPSVRRLFVRDDADQRQYSFSLEFADELAFSSRVISDGTLRFLALLTVLNDPNRHGTLCFEEPENGVHEGRVPMLVEFLRNAAVVSNEPDKPSFQVLLNTHSPKVMEALKDHEIVAADSVVTLDPTRKTRSVRTRMRSGIRAQIDLFNIETDLSRYEVERLLQKQHGTA